MSVKEDYKHFKQTKLPSLALFYFRVWHLTAKPMTQHVVMTAERMTAKPMTPKVMTLRDDTTRCDDLLRRMTAKPMTLRDDASRNLPFSSPFLTSLTFHLLNPLHFFFIQKSRNQVFHVNGKKVVQNNQIFKSKRRKTID